MLSVSVGNRCHSAPAEQSLEAGVPLATGAHRLGLDASLSRKANIDDKVSADQRGHGLGVSLSVYAVSDLEQKSRPFGRFEADVLSGSAADDLGGAREARSMETK